MSRWLYYQYNNNLPLQLPGNKVRIARDHPRRVAPTSTHMIGIQENPTCTLVYHEYYNVYRHVSLGRAWVSPTLVGSCLVWPSFCKRASFLEKIFKTSVLKMASVQWPVMLQELDCWYYTVAFRLKTECKIIDWQLSDKNCSTM